MEPFFEQCGLSAGSSVVLDTREAALAFPRGDLLLAFCPACGFICNVLFEERVAEVASRHEDTQAHSPAYARYLRGLAADLVRRHGLHGRRVVEVGCGQGEFLALLAQLGGNEGLGFDPVYDAGRGVLDGTGARALAAPYDSRQPPPEADLVCCKMTLEHIPDGRIFRDCAFEDIYYEHCSYFTAGSLARLVRAQGLAVDRIDIGYAGQHLTIEAHRAADAATRPPLPGEEPPAGIAAWVGDFTATYARRVSQWRAQLARCQQRGPVVLWGSGSKAVSFMKAVDEEQQIGHVVDINPFRQGRYVACSGQRIMAPAEVPDVRPAAVVVMNPVYREEVAGMLRDMDVDAQVLSL
jgi:SAM-dependent methyltransferase